MPGKTLIIAEIGSTHDGSFGIAGNMIDTAAECGADAVKFQTHIATAETLRNAPMPPYFQGEPRFEYFTRTAFSFEQWRALKKRAEDRGLLFLSSPFSAEAVTLLEAVGMEQYKIPSGEMTNLPMLDLIAATGKPVILSSGMSSWTELDAAVAAVRHHHDRLTVLQCTSEYPCPYDQVGLNVMVEMGRRYGCPVGLSDHTLTIFAPIVAVTLGAQVVEKHLTLSRRLYGSDARHSLEPNEFRQMVDGIRAAEAMLAAAVDKTDTDRFADMKRIFEKSLVTLCAIPAGAAIKAGMIGIKKPGGGIPPARLNEIIGRRTTRDIPADTQLSFTDILEPNV